MSVETKNDVIIITSEPKETVVITSPPQVTKVIESFRGPPGELTIIGVAPVLSVFGRQNEVCEDTAS